MPLLQLAFKNIIHRKGRFALVTLSVVIGVMFVVSIFIFTDGLRSTFGNLSDDIAGDSDLVVRSEQEFGDRNQATPLPTDIQPVLESVSGVQDVVPGLTEFGLVLLDEDGDDIESNFGGAPIIAFNWFQHPRSNAFILNEYGGISGSRPPETPNEFAINQETAIDNDMVLGNTYTLIVPEGEFSGRREMQLVGVFNFASEESDDTLGAVLIAIENQTAVDLFRNGNGYDQYDIYVEEGADVDVIQDNLVATLQASPAAVESLAIAGVEAEVVTTAEIASEVQEIFNNVLDIFRNVLLGFAFVILLVSGFVIFNTFSVVLDQRIKELGLLRAVGITGRQIQRLVLGEALVIGIIATILGFAAGIGVFYLLGFGLSAAGGGSFSIPFVFTTASIIAAIFVGVGVTLISALPSAVRSKRVSPIAAIREGAGALRETVVTRRPILGSVVMGIGVLVAVFALFNNWTTLILFTLIAALLIYWGGTRISEWLGQGAVLVLGGTWLILAAFLDLKSGEVVALYGIGAVVVFIGVNLVSPSFGAGAARGIGYFLKKIFGIVGNLGVENSARNPKRTASTSAALVVGLALVATASVLAVSLKATFSDVLESSVRSDWILCKDECQDAANGNFSPSIADEADELDAVDSTLSFQFVAEGIRVNSSQAADGTITKRYDVFDVFSTDLTKLDQHINVDIQEVSSDLTNTNGVFVYDDRADAYNLAVGSVVDIEFSSGGTTQVEVLGIFSDNRILFADWVITEDLYVNNFATQRDLFVSIIENPSYNTSSVGAALASITRKIDPDVDPQTKEEFNESQTGQIDQVLVVITFFVAVAFIVAVLGIANTLSLSIFERTREIGLLRAVGMRRVQVRRMVRLEGLVIALFGSFTGIALGVIFGIAGVYALPDTFISKLAISPYYLIGYGIVGGIAGLVSALIPAIRASRLKILDAISHQ